MTVYTIDFVYYTYESKNVKKMTIINNLIIRVLVIIPFAMIFSFSEVEEPRSVVVIFSLIRISDIRPIETFFYDIKTHATYENFIRIVKTFLYYLLINHLTACIWIEMSKIEDEETGWLRRIPVPRNPTRDEDSITLSQ